MAAFKEAENDNSEAKNDFLETHCNQNEDSDTQNIRSQNISILRVKTDVQKLTLLTVLTFSGSPLTTKSELFGNMLVQRVNACL